MRVNSRDRTACKTLRTVCRDLRAVIHAGLHAYFEGYLAEMERLLADNDLRGSKGLLKGTVGLGGRMVRSEQLFMDEGGTLPRDKLLTRKRWGGFLQTLLKKKSPKLVLTITVLFPDCLLYTSPSPRDKRQSRMPSSA